MILQGTNGDVTYLRSKQLFDLTGKRVYVKFNQSIAGAQFFNFAGLWLRAPEQVGATFYDGLGWIDRGADARLYKDTSSSYGGGPLVGNWISIRESGGTIYWEYATDNGGVPGTWTAFDNYPVASLTYPITARYVELATYASGTGGSQPAKFDGLNTHANYADISTLTDDFTAIDSAKWSTAGGGTVSSVGGTLQLDAPLSVSAELRSVALYNLQGSSIYFKLPQAPTVGDRFAGLRLTPPGQFDAFIGISAVVHPSTNEFSFFANRTNYTGLGTNGTFNTATHAWFRLRESGGTIYGDTAPSTASNPPVSGDWVNRFSTPVSNLDFPIDALRVIFENDAFDAVNSTTPAQFDGLNTAANSTALAGITATATITESADTGSATASAPVTATSTTTNANDTVSSGATAPVSASLTYTDVGDTGSSTASAPVTANATIGESAETVSCTASVGSIPINASLTASEQADTASSAASAPVGATSVLTETADSVTASSSAPAKATVSLTEAGEGVSSTATSPVTASATLSETADSVSAGATVQAFGSANASVNVTESSDSMTATAQATAGVSATITETADSGTATASSGITASASLTASNDTSTATASSGITASAVIGESADTLIAYTGPVITANVTMTESSDSMTSTAQAIAGASAALTESADSMSATVSSIFLTIGITANLTEAGDSLASAATSPITSTSGVTEQADAVTASAQVAVMGYAVISESGDVLFASTGLFSPIVATFNSAESGDTVIAYMARVDPRLIYREPANDYTEPSLAYR